MMHDGLFEVLEVDVMVHPQHILDQKVIEWLQLHTLDLNYLLVVLNLFGGASDKVLKQIPAEVFLH